VGRRVPIPSWAEAYEARFGHPIKELYGIVEVSIHILQTGERVPGSCGMVLPGYNIRITDDNNALFHSILLAIYLCGQTVRMLSSMAILNTPKRRWNP
jgi:acyl-coenzyme A synthetase/AMP-(fatty) acid ligase